MYVTQGNFMRTLEAGDGGGSLAKIDEAQEGRDSELGRTIVYPNRWQEERNLRSLHKEQYHQPITANIENQKYLDLLKKLIKPEYIWKLLKWIHALDENSKKGLRLLYSIHEYQGNKKFRHVGQSPTSPRSPGMKEAGAHSASKGRDQLDLLTFEPQQFDAKKAKKYFRQLSTKTSYGNTFGVGSSTNDSSLIRRKKFSDLPLSQYFIEAPAKYIERWLSVNDDEEFVNRVFFTVRDIYTIIRGQDAPVSALTGVYQGKRADKVPRFDKILTEVRHGPRSKSTAKYNTGRMLQPAADVEGFLAANREYYGRPKVDLKARVDQALRGQPFDITGYWAEGSIKDPKTTSYMASWRGLQFKDEREKAKILDWERTSCAGATVPDPFVVTANSTRLKNFSGDLNTMLRTNFGYTGDTWAGAGGPYGGTPSAAGTQRGVLW